MFRYVLLLFVLLFTIFSITACGGDWDEYDRSMAAASHQFISAETLAKLKSELIKADSTMGHSTVEVTINHISFSHDVHTKGDNPNDPPMGFKPDPGYVYIDVDVSVKNMQKKEVDTLGLVNQIDLHACYDEESGTYLARIDRVFPNFNHPLKPLAAGRMHFLINCPEEVENSHKALFLIFALEGKKYQYTIR